MPDGGEEGADWAADWQPMVDRVGEDFSDGQPRYGPDPIEQGAVRRYLEPLEWDCPLHADEEAAREHGYQGVIAPYTSVLTFTTPRMWAPGKAPIFVEDGPDAQPARSPINNPRPGPAPRTTGYFATDLELEFVRPPGVGERLGRRGNRLVACVPKETAVGRGAFNTWETEIVDEAGEVVARMRTQTYSYNPRPRHTSAEAGA